MDTGGSLNSFELSTSSLRSRTASRDRASLTISKDGPVTAQEKRAWYFYDWCFSPYWQVADTTFKWLLKRLAEQAVEAGNFVDGKIMSPGGYPAAVLFVNSGVQVVALLTFSAFADYGNYRKVLLRWSTYACSIILILVVFCNTGSAVWTAGVLRILMGVFFVQTNVCYNAYLPLLTGQSPEVLELTGAAAEKKQEELADNMSSKGFGCGYCGGMTMQIVAWIIFLVFQCDATDIGKTCTEEKYTFHRVFWIGFCICLCGVWWLIFSIYTFAHLKERAGGPFPQGVNMLCLGWQKTGETLYEVFRLRNTLLYVIGYFIWSDGIATIVNVSTLYIDEDDTDSAPCNITSIIVNGTNTYDITGDCAKDSGKFMMLVGATVLALIGVFVILFIQNAFKLSSKTLLMAQLLIYGVISVGSASGFMKAFNGMGYYLCMVPMMLMLGSQQAYQRSIYSSLSPVGKEAQMFAFYTITDKGSSLIGYAVIAVVHTRTESYLGAFWYCALAFFSSAVILYFVDVQQGMRDAGKGEPTEDDEVQLGPRSSTNSNTVRF